MLIVSPGFKSQGDFPLEVGTREEELEGLCEEELREDSLTLELREELTALEEGAADTLETAGALDEGCAVLEAGALEEGAALETGTLEAGTLEEGAVET